MQLRKRPIPGDEIANQLYFGDCLDVMDTFPDKCIDLILCDLPYGMTANKWDSVIPFNQIWYAFRRLLASKGNIVLFSQGLFTARLILHGGEDLFRYKMVWVKNRNSGNLLAKKMPMRGYEDICIFGYSNSLFNQIKLLGKPYKMTSLSKKASSNYGYAKHKTIYVNVSGDRVPIDVLNFKIVSSKNVGNHPTQKPIDLCRYLVKMYSNKNGIVLDATMGSGTIPLAAKMEGRKYIGIENDSHWYEHAKKRIETAQIELI